MTSARVGFVFKSDLMCSTLSQNDATVNVTVTVIVNITVNIAVTPTSTINVSFTDFNIATTDN